MQEGVSTWQGSFRAVFTEDKKVLKFIWQGKAHGPHGQGAQNSQNTIRQLETKQKDHWRKKRKEGLFWTCVQRLFALGWLMWCDSHKPPWSGPSLSTGTADHPSPLNEVCLHQKCFCAQISSDCLLSKWTNLTAVNTGNLNQAQHTDQFYTVIRVLDASSFWSSDRRRSSQHH